MALIRYNPIITGIKGKLSNTIFQSSTAGNQIRSTNKYKYIANSNQYRSFNKLVSMRSSWKFISEAKQLDWGNNASDWPLYNKFGIVYTPSGFLYYTTCNLNLIALNLPVLEVNPTKINSENVSPIIVTTDISSNIIIKSSSNSSIEQYISIFVSNALSLGAISSSRNYYYGASYDCRYFTSINATTIIERLFGNVISGKCYMFKCIVRAAQFPYPEQMTYLRVIAP